LFEKYFSYTIKKDLVEFKAITFFKNKVKKPFNIFLHNINILYLYNKIFFNFNINITTHLFKINNTLLIS